MMQQRFINGMLLRSVEAPSPSATILYIHGLGESGLCLERLMTHPILKDFSHLSPDLPGYGKSPWPETPLSISEHADLLADWLSYLDLQQIIIFGHSMGGVIGSFFCERYPDMVRLFVNVEGNISFEDCTYSCEIAGYTLSEFMEGGFDRFRDEIYGKSLSDRALRFYHASLLMSDPQTIHKNSRELVELSRPEDLACRLGSLKVPACYALGNPRGTQEHSRKLLKAANVPLWEVHNAGHWPFIDQPDTFARGLLNLFRTYL